MKRAKHTPEQIIRKLREAEKLLASGKDLEEVCRGLEQSFPPADSVAALLNGQRRSKLPVDLVDQFVRLEVRGRLLRNPLGEKISDFTIWAPITWIISGVAAALTAVYQDAVRQYLRSQLKRVIHRRTV